MHIHTARVDAIEMKPFGVTLYRAYISVPIGEQPPAMPIQLTYASFAEAQEALMRILWP